MSEGRFTLHLSHLHYKCHTKEMTLELDLENGMLLADESKSIASLETIGQYIVSGIKSVECRKG